MDSIKKNIKIVTKNQSSVYIQTDLRGTAHCDMGKLPLPPPPSPSNKRTINMQIIQVDISIFQLKVPK
jgi:hypothetical protein